MTTKTTTSTETFWAAILDGDIEGADLRATKAAADADAQWLRGHPARHDRVLHGHGGDVRVARVRECEWTGEMIEIADAEVL
jgi:hypothetical protein